MWANAMQSQHCLHYAHKFMNPSSIPFPSPFHEILKESLLVLAYYGHVLTETTPFMSVSTLTMEQKLSEVHHRYCSTIILNTCEEL